MLPTNVSLLQKSWEMAAVSADHPACTPCTWVWLGGQFRLKFVHAGCSEHARIPGGAS